MMRMRGLAFAVLLAGAPVLSADEAVAVHGRVVDAVSGAAIATAEVTAGSARATTDATGAFALSLAPGHVDAHHHCRRLRRSDPPR